ncbi:lef-5 [Hyphantria cunea granulovirus]|uniref:Lef-5 n=1 Tax=Hyphantria cunea granulovirus TaxID=307448 RepID=A0AAF1D289_9BBAC|nr:lef-5 [Hyphantria cunea granulovirus]QBQ01629.1 lef-5 [Hyphantria cunea granulovirus]
MSFDERPRVAQNEPLHYRQLFETFTTFRINQDYNGLIEYLIKNYPANVKNRTFNFVNSGHTFHLLYAYIPSVSNKERKQIRLDCVEKLIQNTTNDHKLYIDLFKLMGDNANMCPCELISARLNQHIEYVQSLQNKNFDTKPIKLKKEPIDAVLFKYSINWKHSLRKKKFTSTAVKKTTKNKSMPDVPTPHNATKVGSEEEDGVWHKSALENLNGATVLECQHRYECHANQLRSGDEIVSFVYVCQLCNISYVQSN